MPWVETITGVLEHGTPVSIDFETFDPGLVKKGGSTDAYSCTKGGFPFCFSAYTRTEDGVEYDFWVDDRAPHWRDTFQVLAQALKAGGLHLIGANLKYELAWLHWLEVWTPKDLMNPDNRFSDILVRGALIDSSDRRKLSLDGQADLYRLPAKETDALFIAAQLAGIPNTKSAVYQNLYKLPRDVVKNYNRHDAWLAFEIYERQKPALAAEDLLKVLELEERLTPVLTAMESKGVRVDTQALDVLEKDLETRIAALRSRCQQVAGADISPNPSKSLKDALADQGLSLPKTSKGAFKTDLKTLTAYKAKPFVKDILDWRKLSKFKKTFLENAIRKNLAGDRIYTTLNQLASDKSGTVTGRLSCSGPNLQQIPKRDEEFGPLIRRLFVADEGFQFLSADYSKQENRVAAHLAVVNGIEGGVRFANAFIANPDLDVHSHVAEIAGLKDLLGEKLGYLAGKTLNFALSYGQQEKGTRASLKALGVPDEIIPHVIFAYHAAYPHVQASMATYDSVARRQGFVRTILGRKQRFEKWVPSRKVETGPKDYKGYSLALPYAEAKKIWEPEKHGFTLVRAKTYAAFNYAVQGSAGDQTKVAMNALFYGCGIVPNLQVHDELIDCQGTPEKAEIYKKVMESAVELKVPVRVSVELSQNWAG